MSDELKETIREFKKEIPQIIELLENQPKEEFCCLSFKNACIAEYIENGGFIFAVDNFGEIFATNPIPFKYCPWCGKEGER